MLHYLIGLPVLIYISSSNRKMDLKVKNITIRIKELDTEIQKLEQRLAAKNWERKKYLQFSDDEVNKVKHYLAAK